VVLAGRHGAAPQPLSTARSRPAAAGHGDDLTLEVVRGCSHRMPEERPDRVADRAWLCSA